MKINYAPQMTKFVRETGIAQDIFSFKFQEFFQEKV
jgi:hypothetical protein